MSFEIMSGIKETAKSLGVDPIDLATAISYETAGTFDPTKSGPTTQWGQHRGLIQFGEPQAKKYGVDFKDPINSQLGKGKAVEKYLRDTGVKEGMGLLDIYSAINAGGVGRYDRTDENNGGARGTVAEKVKNQMGGHIKNAQRLFASYDVSDDEWLAGFPVQNASVNQEAPEDQMLDVSDEEWLAGFPVQNAPAPVPEMTNDNTPVKDPYADMGVLERAAAKTTETGFGAGVADAFYGAGQIAGNVAGAGDDWNKKVNEREKRIDYNLRNAPPSLSNFGQGGSPLYEATGFDVERIAGNIIGLPAGLVAKGVGMLPKASAFLGNLGISVATAPVEVQDEETFTGEKAAQTAATAAFMGLLATPSFFQRFKDRVFSDVDIDKALDGVEGLPEEMKTNNAVREVLRGMRKNKSALRNAKNADDFFEIAKEYGVNPEINDVLGGALQSEAAMARTTMSTLDPQRMRDNDFRRLDEIDNAAEKLKTEIADGEIIPTASEVGEMVRNEATAAIDGARENVRKKTAPLYEQAKYKEPFYYVSEADKAKATNKEGLDMGLDPDVALDVAQGKITSDGAKVYQRPLIQTLMRQGGIEPNSEVAKELYATGVTPQTAPALFKKGGIKSLDNIPEGELDKFNLVTEGGYYDQNAILDQIKKEITPSRGAEPDMFTVDKGRDDAAAELRELGIDPNKATGEEIREALRVRDRNREYKQSQEAPSQPANGVEEIPYQKVYDENARFRTVDKDILKDKRILYYADKAGKKFTNLTDEKAPMNSVERLHLARQLLDDDLAQAKAKSRKTEFRDLQITRDKLDNALKQDDKFAKADGLERAMHQDLEKMSLDGVAKLANKRDDTLHTIGKDLFSDAYPENKFFAVRNKLSQETRKALAASYMDDVMSKYKANTAMRRIFENKRVENKFMALLRDDPNAKHKIKAIKNVDKIIKNMQSSRSVMENSTTLNKAIDVSRTVTPSLFGRMSSAILKGDGRGIVDSLIGQSVASAGAVKEIMLDMTEKEQDAFFNFIINPQNTKKFLRVIQGLEDTKSKNLNKLGWERLISNTKFNKIAGFGRLLDNPESRAKIIQQISKEIGKDE